MASIKVLLALLGAVAVVRGQFPQFPQFPQPFQPQPRCQAFGPSDNAFQCNALSVYNYTDYYLPNAVGDGSAAAAMQSAMAYSSLFNNTQCDASAEELQQFICITFFPPCVRSQDGQLHPVNPVPPCQSWCESLEMRCGGALPVPFGQQSSWVSCANIYQGRQRQCWRYISADSSSSISSPSSSISSPSSPSSSFSSSHSGEVGANTMTEMNPLGGLLSQGLSSNESTATDAPVTESVAKALLLNRHAKAQPPSVVYVNDNSEDDDNFAVVININDASTTPDPTATSDPLQNQVNANQLSAGANAGSYVVVMGGDKASPKRMDCESSEECHFTIYTNNNNNNNNEVQVASQEAAGSSTTPAYGSSTAAPSNKDSNQV